MIRLPWLEPMVAGRVLVACLSVLGLLVVLGVTAEHRWFGLMAVSFKGLAVALASTG